MQNYDGVTTGMRQRSQVLASLYLVAAFARSAFLQPNNVGLALFPCLRTGRPRLIIHPCPRHPQELLSESFLIWSHRAMKRLLLIGNVHRGLLHSFCLRARPCRTRTRACLLSHSMALWQLPPETTISATFVALPDVESPRRFRRSLQRPTGAPMDGRQHTSGIPYPSWKRVGAFFRGCCMCLRMSTTTVVWPGTMDGTTTYTQPQERSLLC